MKTDCTRCKHSQSQHINYYVPGSHHPIPKTRRQKNCNLCDCEGWWGGICWQCGDYCIQPERLCFICARYTSPQPLVKKNLAWLNSSEQKKKEDYHWVLEAHKTLKQVKRILSGPTVYNSTTLRLGKTSPD